MEEHCTLAAAGWSLLNLFRHTTATRTCQWRCLFTPGRLPYGLRLEGFVNVNHQRPISSVIRGHSSVMAITTTMSGVSLLVAWRTGSGSVRSKGYACSPRPETGLGRGDRDAFLAPFLQQSLPSPYHYMRTSGHGASSRKHLV